METILPSLFKLLAPLLPSFWKRTYFLLPNISCQMKDGEKISVTVDIKKYSENLFYGEFTLTIKQIGGIPGLAPESSYPGYGIVQSVQIAHGYSSRASKRFDFKKTGAIENDLQIRVVGDIGNDIKKVRILVIKKDIINKLLQREGQLKLKMGLLALIWPWSERINYKI